MIWKEGKRQNKEAMQEVGGKERERQTLRAEKGAGKRRSVRHNKAEIRRRRVDRGALLRTSQDQHVGGALI